MVWVCPNEGKELSQQDTVGGFVPAVLDGQGLQQGEGAAPVAGDVPAPAREPECYSWQQEDDPTTTNAAGSDKFDQDDHWDSTEVWREGINPAVPLAGSGKLDILVADHLQVGRGGHAAQEHGLAHGVGDHLGLRGWFTGWSIIK